MASNLLAAQEPAASPASPLRVGYRVRVHSTTEPGRIAGAIAAVDDEFFEPEWERFVAREMLGVEPIEIPGGHFPMAEDPEALAEVLDRLAREHAGKA